MVLILRRTFFRGGISVKSIHQQSSSTAVTRWYMSSSPTR